MHLLPMSYVPGLDSTLRKSFCDSNFDKNRWKYHIIDGVHVVPVNEQGYILYQIDGKS